MPTPSSKTEKHQSFDSEPLHPKPVVNELYRGRESVGERQLSTVCGHEGKGSASLQVFQDSTKAQDANSTATRGSSILIRFR